MSLDEIEIHKTLFMLSSKAIGVFDFVQRIVISIFLDLKGSCNFNE